jgi:hypothetical protein
MRYKRVLEISYKIRKRLGSLNYIEKTHLEKRMKFFDREIKRRQFVSQNLMEDLHSRLLEIQAHQMVIEETGSSSNSTKADDKCTNVAPYNDKTLKRAIQQKKKELDPEAIKESRRNHVLSLLRSQNVPVVFDRGSSSLTELLEKYGRKELKLETSNSPQKVAVISQRRAKDSKSYSKLDNSADPELGTVSRLTGVISRETGTVSRQTGAISRQSSVNKQ